MKKLLTILSFIIFTTAALAADKYISSSGDLVIKTAVTKKVNLNDTLYTTQAGSVGVGTASPAKKFEVNGAAKISGLNANGLHFDMAGSTDYIIKESTSADRMQFGGSSEAASIYHDFSSPAVGIGISNPGSYYDQSNDLVLGSTSVNGGMTIVSGTTNNSMISFAKGTSGSDAYRGMIQYAQDASASVEGFYVKVAGGNTKLSVHDTGVAQSYGVPGRLVWEGVYSNAVSNGGTLKARVTHSGGGGYGTGFVDMKFSGTNDLGTTRGWCDARRFYKQNGSGGGSMPDNVTLGTDTCTNAACVLSHVSLGVYDIICTNNSGSPWASGTLYIKIVIGGMANDSTYARGVTSVVYSGT